MSQKNHSDVNKKNTKSQDLFFLSGPLLIIKINYWKETIEKFCSSKKIQYQSLFPLACDNENKLSIVQKKIKK